MGPDAEFATVQRDQMPMQLYAGDLQQQHGGVIPESQMPQTLRGFQESNSTCGRCCRRPATRVALVVVSVLVAIGIIVGAVVGNMSAWHRSYSYSYLNLN